MNCRVSSETSLFANGVSSTQSVYEICGFVNTRVFFRLNQVFAKFDEVKMSGNMLATADLGKLSFNSLIHKLFLDHDIIFYFRQQWKKSRKV